jgi:disulfide bond formation protein DsbB
MARGIPLGLLAASVAVIVGALLFQYVGGLQPCELCLFQRWPYFAVIALCFLAVLVGNRRASRAASALAAIIFLAGAVLAFYHVGVEQRWFAGPASCTAPALTAASVADLRAQLLGTPPVRCDEVQWSLFGISLAGWNLVMSLALAILAAIGAARLSRTP